MGEKQQVHVQNIIVTKGQLLNDRNSIKPTFYIHVLGSHRLDNISFHDFSVTISQFSMTSVSRHFAENIGKCGLPIWILIDNKIPQLLANFACSMTFL